MTDQDILTGPGGEPGRRPAGPPRHRRALVAVALTSGLALGAVGIARAAKDGGPGVSPAAAASPSPSASAAPDRDRGEKYGGWGRHHGHSLHSLLHALHGQFVTPKPGGGYQTVDAQRGSVTAVSATAITLRSEDGFTKTYVVNADTRVKARTDGIAALKVGDSAVLMAVVSGGTSTATIVIDLSELDGMRRDWYDRGRFSAPSAGASNAA